MQVIRRFWNGLVAAVAGAAVGLVIQIVGQMTMAWPINSLRWIVAAGIGVGFLIGASLPPGPRQPS